VVCYSEGIGRGLTVADEFAVRGLFLSVEVVVQDFIEALQANTIGFALLVISNRGPAPDALDYECLFRFLFVYHSASVLPRG
jgi:hypothetical protein